MSRSILLLVYDRKCRTIVALCASSSPIIFCKTRSSDSNDGRNDSERKSPILPGPSRSRKANLKIPHHRLSFWITYDHWIKVDLLTSGTINLPAILASDSPQNNNILVMQLFDLLVMKMQGWWYHSFSFLFLDNATAFGHARNSARR